MGFAEIELVVVGCSSTQISDLKETRYIIHHRVALPPFHELKRIITLMEGRGAIKQTDQRLGAIQSTFDGPYKEMFVSDRKRR